MASPAKRDFESEIPGTPEPIVEFFLFVAEEIRHSLAQLGYRSLDEIIGRNDLLKVRDVALPKSGPLNLNLLIDPVSRRSSEETNGQGDAEKVIQDLSIDEELLSHRDVMQAINENSEYSLNSTICNTDRAVGAALSGEIALRHGDYGFGGRIALNFVGSAGQSFGAFNIQNLHLSLTGESNDYVGKSMCGGQIVIKPAADALFNSWENVIIGNTCLYGATGGMLFAAGQAGERFAIRNSGATAVIEGAGDHCCEYMTGEQS